MELQGRDPWKNENLLTLLCYFCGWIDFCVLCGFGLGLRATGTLPTAIAKALAVRICHYCQFQFPIASVVVSYKLPVPGVTSAAALLRTAANGRKVWECFMLGVDPTKTDDDFKITRFWMEGGKPMFEFSHSTDGTGNSFVPRLKVKGKAELSDGWGDVSEDGNDAFRFFADYLEGFVVKYGKIYGYLKSEENWKWKRFAKIQSRRLSGVVSRLSTARLPRMHPPL